MAVMRDRADELQRPSYRPRLRPVLKWALVAIIFLAGFFPSAVAVYRHREVMVSTTERGPADDLVWVSNEGSDPLTLTGLDAATHQRLTLLCNHSAGSGKILLSCNDARRPAEDRFEGCAGNVLLGPNECEGLAWSFGWYRWTPPQH